MGKIKELLYKEQNPEMFEEEAFDFYEPQWAGDEPKRKSFNEVVELISEGIDDLIAENEKLKAEIQQFEKLRPLLKKLLLI